MWPVQTYSSGMYLKELSKTMRNLRQASRCGEKLDTSHLHGVAVMSDTFIGAIKDY
jgi:endonuclease IV